MPSPAAIVGCVRSDVVSDRAAKSVPPPLPGYLSRSASSETFPFGPDGYEYIRLTDALLASSRMLVVYAGSSARILNGP